MINSVTIIRWLESNEFVECLVCYENSTRRYNYIPKSVQQFINKKHYRHYYIVANGKYNYYYYDRCGRVF